MENGSRSRSRGERVYPHNVSRKDKMGSQLKQRKNGKRRLTWKVKRNRILVEMGIKEAGGGRSFGKILEYTSRNEEDLT